MYFDFADLALFRHVVEAGSITHGAERANLALAAASTRIRKMEDALGTPLLIRSRGGVVATPAGRTMLQHARTILTGFGFSCAASTRSAGWSNAMSASVSCRRPPRNASPVPPR